MLRARVLPAVLTLLLRAYLPNLYAQTAMPKGGGVYLKVISVRPEKDQFHYLLFRVKLRLANLNVQPILLETVDGKAPLFTGYEKWLGWPPHWLNLGGGPDAPAPNVIELKPGQSIEYEQVIGSVAASRMLPTDGIPLRGVHRVRVRYFLAREDLKRLQRMEKSAIQWAVSPQFRIDWPPDCATPCMPPMKVIPAGP